MEALLKDLIGFHFSAKWLWKSEGCFFAGEGSAMKWALLVWVLSLDALSFYETVEIGTL